MQRAELLVYLMVQTPTVKCCINVTCQLQQSASYSLCKTWGLWEGREELEVNQRTLRVPVWQCWKVSSNLYGWWAWEPHRALTVGDGGADSGVALCNVGKFLQISGSCTLQVKLLLATSSIILTISPKNFWQAGSWRKNHPDNIYICINIIQSILCHLRCYKVLSLDNC